GVNRRSAQNGSRRARTLQWGGIAVRRRKGAARRLSFGRVRRTQRHVLRERNSGRKLLVRVFRCPPDDVAAAERGTKPKTFWNCCFAIWPRTQLPGPPDDYRHGKIRSNPELP